MKKKILTTLATGAVATTTTVGLIAILEARLEKDIYPQIKPEALLKKVGEVTADDIVFYYKDKKIDPQDYGVTILSYGYNDVNGVGVADVKYNFTGKIKRRDISLDFETTGFRTAKDDLNDSNVVGLGDKDLTAAHFSEKINELNQEAGQDQSKLLKLAKMLIGNMLNQDQYDYHFSDITYDENENVTFRVRATYKLEPKDSFEREIKIPASKFLAQKTHEENLANDYKKLSDEVAQWINDNLGPEKYSRDIKKPLEKVKKETDSQALPNKANPPAEKTIIAARNQLQKAFDKAKVDKAIFDLEEKQAELKHYDINHLENNPNARRVIKHALDNFSRSNISPEDVENVPTYKKFIQKLDDALTTAKQIQAAKEKYDEELKNKFQPEHFGIDNETKDEYENAVQKIVNDLNEAQQQELTPEQAIEKYEQAQQALSDLKTRFNDRRQSAIDEYEQALNDLNTSKEALHGIDRYAKLEKDTEDLINAKNISVDKANNYANTTIANIIAQTRALNEFNNSIPAAKEALDKASENYDQALERVNNLKNDPKYAEFKAELETKIKEQTDAIAKNITDKTIDVEKYNNAAAALQAILIKGA
ncbi:hypothetical protein NXS15_03585, partial [Mycoplasma sp. CSL7475-4]|uniref:hypothetical protein n=1 Tax=Mycoplasma sp. CSL7475-4 TaxID=2973942 RepID=UPI00216B391A